MAQRFSVTAALLIILVVPASALADGIANPIQLVVRDAHPAKIVSVSCTDTAGRLGHWERVIGRSGVAIGEDAVKDWEPGQPADVDPGTILFCRDAAGMPGAISGAPDELLLRSGTYVLRSYALVVDILGADGEELATDLFTPLPLDEPVIEDRSVFAALLGPHEMVVVPNAAGKVVILPQAQYVDHPWKGLREAEGCYVTSFVAGRSSPTNSHYDRACSFDLLKQMH